MKKAIILFFVIFSLSFSFELKKENFEIVKNKNLKLPEDEMKNQSEKIVEVFNKEISDRIESKNKGLEKIQRGITILQDLEYIDGARYYENYFANQLSNEDL